MMKAVCKDTGQGLTYFFGIFEEETVCDESWHINGT
jgi:hypothetical protein